MLPTSRVKGDLRSDGAGSFMKFYMYHAQSDGLTDSPACLGPLAGFCLQTIAVCLPYERILTMTFVHLRVISRNAGDCITRDNKRCCLRL